MTRDELPTMIEGFLEAALFTAPEDVIRPTSGEFPYSEHKDRITKRMRARATRTCTEFLARNEHLLLTYPARECGHDLAYTINGHGCGFWEGDHCTKDTGNHLTTAAHRFSSFTVYRTRSGWYNME